MNIIRSLEDKLDVFEHWASDLGHSVLAAFLVGLAFTVAFFAILMTISVFVHFDDRLMVCAGGGLILGLVMGMVSWSDFR
jgi:hypothetical protein